MILGKKLSLLLAAPTVLAADVSQILSLVREVIDGTATTDAPFVAQTDVAAIKFGDATSSYTLPQPIETSLQSSDHQEGDKNIFELMGITSPYYISDGWGVYDWGIPDQCTIKQVHLLSRHGSRYPTSEIAVGKKFATHNFTASDELSFLNTWKYIQGINLLTKYGNQQLFDKGVRTFFRYGELFDWGANGTVPKKVVARTTTQERMVASADYFLSGFFGLDWEKYADLVKIPEAYMANSTLSPYGICVPYVKLTLLTLSADAAAGFAESYLSDAVSRFNGMLSGLTLTFDDVLQMQDMCAYEANNNGYSHFCGLFTQEEWENYEYYQSWTFYNDQFFGSPMSRPLGIGWVDEFKQRLTGSPANSSEQSTQNTTLNSDPSTFPLDEALYFDFTHDAVIAFVLAALGMEQFKSNFTGDGVTQPFDVSKVVPFAAQIYFEVIECDHAVATKRSEDCYCEQTGPTKYVHMLLNDHTISLPENIADYCEPRDDGWCELDKFVEYLDTLYDKSYFDATCFGSNYDPDKFVNDGVPDFY